MAANTGTKIVDDGLVFHFDLENEQRSWRGKPTTNLVQYPYFIDNNGDDTLVAYSNFGFGDNNTREVVDEQPAVGFGKSVAVIKNTTDYGTINYTTNDLGNLNQGDKVTVSWWVKGVGDTIGKSVRIWGFNSSPDGAVSTGLTGLGPLTDEWQRFSYTYTWTKSTPSNNGGFVSYIRVNYGSGDRFLASNPQIEAGDILTPFVNGQRLDTASIVDVSPNKNVITANNLTYQSGTYPTFDGTDDYITVGSSSNFNISKTVSILGVIGINDTGWNGIFGTESGGSFIHFQTVNGHLNVYVYGPNVGFSSSTAYVLGGIHHVGFTFDTSEGEGLKIYVDGELIDSVASTNTNSISSAPLVSIGKVYDSSRHMNGEIYNLQVYNRALTADEVKKNFVATRGRYSV